MSRLEDDLPLEELAQNTESVLGPNVTDGVAALVGRPLDRVVRSRPSLLERHGREGLQRVAQNVEAGVGSHSLRHMLNVQGIDQSQGWLQGSVSNTRLGL